MNRRSPMNRRSLLSFIGGVATTLCATVVGYPIIARSIPFTDRWYEPMPESGIRISREAGKRLLSKLAKRCGLCEETARRFIRSELDANGDGVFKINPKAIPVECRNFNASEWDVFLSAERILRTLRSRYSGKVRTYWMDETGFPKKLKIMEG